MLSTREVMESAGKAAALAEKARNLYAQAEIARREADAIITKLWAVLLAGVGAKIGAHMYDGVDLAEAGQAKPEAPHLPGLGSMKLGPYEERR